jgi:formylmethanofuran dehydrogenase subunit A
MDSVSDLAKDNKIAIHMTHVQFISYGGFDWASISSKADIVAKYFNTHPHVSMDLGQVVFTDTTTMTADGPFQYRLHQLTGNKWMNADVESECGSGVVPIRYRAKNYVHAVMWAIGLELALLAEDPWRVFLTTDHPNGGPFTAYPRVISWLISSQARGKVLKRLPRLARVRTNLSSIDREYSLYEIATITRAATAKSLGLKNKGNLSPGADADISIYDFNPKELDLSKDYVEVMKAFRRAKYTIKNGDILVKDGDIVKSTFGEIYWLNPQISQDLMNSTVQELTGKFKEYYTIDRENYEISEDYLTNSHALNTTASV